MRAKEIEMNNYEMYIYIPGRLQICQWETYVVSCHCTWVYTKILHPSTFFLCKMLNNFLIHSIPKTTKLNVVSIFVLVIESHVHIVSCNLSHSSFGTIHSSSANRRLESLSIHFRKKQNFFFHCFWFLHVYATN